MDDLGLMFKKAPLQGFPPRNRLPLYPTMIIEGEKKKEPEAAPHVLELLKDGQWHKAAAVKLICKRYNSTYDSVANYCGIAEGISHKWCCIVNEYTPENAPREGGL